MAGYSFSLEGWRDAHGEQVWLRASQLHRDLRWSKLEPDLAVMRERRRSAELHRLASADWPYGLDR